MKNNSDLLAPLAKGIVCFQATHFDSQMSGPWLLAVSTVEVKEIVKRVFCFWYMVVGSMQSSTRQYDYTFYKVDIRCQLAPVGLIICYLPDLLPTPTKKFHRISTEKQTPKNNNWHWHIFSIRCLLFGVLEQRGHGVSPKVDNTCF